MLGTRTWGGLTIEQDAGAGPRGRPFARSSHLPTSFEAYYYFTYASAVGRGPASGRFDPG